MAQRYWTGAELETLRSRYPHEDTKDVAEALNRTMGAINAKAHELRVLKTPEAYAALRQRLEANPNSIGTRFVKGQIPPNKGQKMDDRVKEKVARTFFVKGHQPHNHKPVGSERWSKGYLQVKVAEPRRWLAKHRVIWEEVNGPVPPHHIVRFKDRDTTNFAMENLELVHRGQHAQDNHNIYPLEIAQAVRLTNKINQLIKNRNHGDKKQATRPPQSPV
jgi:hypothetical protein